MRFVEKTNSFKIKLEGGAGEDLDENVRRIARQRIQTLFSLAKTNVNQDPQLAQHYVDMARTIAMSARIRLPVEYRRQVCGRCKSFILPGVNCRVRVQQRRESHVVVTCLKCGGQTRIPLAKKQRNVER